MPRTSRLNTPWTDAEVRSMRRLASKGYSARQFADRIGRSRGSVAFKAMCVGVSFHAVRQPKGAQRKALRTRRRRARMARAA